MTSRARTSFRKDAAAVHVMDAFWPSRSPDDAFARYQALLDGSEDVALQAVEPALPDGFKPQGLLAPALVGDPGIIKTRRLLHFNMDHINLVGINPEGRVSCHECAGTMHAILSKVCGVALSAVSESDRERAPFDAHTDALLRVCGVLAPEVGAVKPEHTFMRENPLCKLFGYTRGTPLGRFYLDRFLDQIRPMVKGRAMEVGGDGKSQTVMGFSDVDEYVS